MLSRLQGQAPDSIRIQAPIQDFPSQLNNSEAIERGVKFLQELRPEEIEGNFSKVCNTLKDRFGIEDTSSQKGKNLLANLTKTVIALRFEEPYQTYCNEILFPVGAVGKMLIPKEAMCVPQETVAAWQKSVDTFFGNTSPPDAYKVIVGTAVSEITSTVKGLPTVLAALKSSEPAGELMGQLDTQNLSNGIEEGSVKPDHSAELQMHTQNLSERFVESLGRFDHLEGKAKELQGNLETLLEDAERLNNPAILKELKQSKKQLNWKENSAKALELAEAVALGASKYAQRSTEAVFEKEHDRQVRSNLQQTTQLLQQDYSLIKSGQGTVVFSRNIRSARKALEELRTFSQDIHKDLQERGVLEARGETYAQDLLVLNTKLEKRCIEMQKSQESAKKFLRGAEFVVDVAAAAVTICTMGTAAPVAKGAAGAGKATFHAIQSFYLRDLEKERLEIETRIREVGNTASNLAQTRQHNRAHMQALYSQLSNISEEQLSLLSRDPRLHDSYQKVLKSTSETVQELILNPTIKDIQKATQERESLAKQKEEAEAAFLKKKSLREKAEKELKKAQKSQNKLGIEAILMVDEAEVNCQRTSFADKSFKKAQEAEDKAEADLLKINQDLLEKDIELKGLNTLKNTADDKIEDLQQSEERAKKIAGIQNVSGKYLDNFFFRILESYYSPSEDPQQEAIDKALNDIGDKVDHLTDLMQNGIMQMSRVNTLFAQAIKDTRVEKKLQEWLPKELQETFSKKIEAGCVGGSKLITITAGIYKMKAAYDIMNPTNGEVVSSDASDSQQLTIDVLRNASRLISPAFPVLIAGLELIVYARQHRKAPPPDRLKILSEGLKDLSNQMTDQIGGVHEHLDSLSRDNAKNFRVINECLDTVEENLEFEIQCIEKVIEESNNAQEFRNVCLHTEKTLSTFQTSNGYRSYIENDTYEFTKNQLMDVFSFLRTQIEDSAKKPDLNGAFVIDLHDPMKYALLNPSRTTGFIATELNIRGIPSFHLYEHYVYMFSMLSSKILYNGHHQDFAIKNIEGISEFLLHQGYTLKRFLSVNALESAFNTYIETRNALIVSLIEDTDLVVREREDLLIAKREGWLKKNKELIQACISIKSYSSSLQISELRKFSYLDLLNTPIKTRDIQRIANLQSYNKLIEQSERNESSMDRFLRSRQIYETETNEKLANQRKKELQTLTSEVAGFKEKSLIEILEERGNIDPEQRRSINGNFIEIGFKINTFWKNNLKAQQEEEDKEFKEIASKSQMRKEEKDLEWLSIQLRWLKNQLVLTPHIKMIQSDNEIDLRSDHTTYAKILEVEKGASSNVFCWILDSGWRARSFPVEKAPKVAESTLFLWKKANGCWIDRRVPLKHPRLREFVAEFIEDPTGIMFRNNNHLETHHYINPLHVNAVFPSKYTLKGDLIRVEYIPPGDIRKAIRNTDTVKAKAFEELFTFSLIHTSETQKKPGLEGRTFLVLSDKLNVDQLKQLISLSSYIKPEQLKQLKAPSAIRFNLEGSEYVKMPTSPDGACALHALLGTLEDGEYYKENAREAFKEALLLKMQQDPQDENVIAVKELLKETLKSHLSSAIKKENPSSQMLFPWSKKGLLLSIPHSYYEEWTWMSQEDVEKLKKPKTHEYKQQEPLSDDSEYSDVDEVIEVGASSYEKSAFSKFQSTLEGIENLDDIEAFGDIKINEDVHEWVYLPIFQFMLSLKSDQPFIKKRVETLLTGSDAESQKPEWKGFFEKVRKYLSEYGPIKTLSNLQLKTCCAAALKNIKSLRMPDESIQNYLISVRRKETLLHLVASEGSIDLVVLLLEKGVEINLRDKEGKTALERAVINGHADVALLLMLYRADDASVLNVHKILSQNLSQSDEQTVSMYNHFSQAVQALTTGQNRLHLAINLHQVYTQNSNPSLLKSVKTAILFLSKTDLIHQADAEGNLPIDMLNQMNFPIQLKHKDDKRILSFPEGTIGKRDLEKIPEAVWEELGDSKHPLIGIKISECWRLLKASHQKALESLKEEEANIWITQLGNEKLINGVLEDSQKKPKSPLYQKPKEVALKILDSNPSLLLDIINTDRKSFLDLLEEGGPKNAILERKERQEKCLAEQESELDGFVLSEAVYKRYLETIMREDFWFNTQEIHLGALLFNKKVQVVSTQKDDEENERILPSENLFNPQSEQEITVIYHEGNHFSRCIISAAFDCAKTLRMGKNPNQKNIYRNKLHELIKNYGEFLEKHINGEGFGKKSLNPFKKALAEAKVLLPLNEKNLIPLAFPQKLIKAIENQLSLMHINGIPVPYYSFGLNSQKTFYELSIEYQVFRDQEDIDPEEYCRFVIAEIGIDTVGAFYQSRSRGLLLLDEKDKESEEVFYNEFLIQAMYTHCSEGLGLPGKESFRLFKAEADSLIPIEKPFAGIFQLLDKKKPTKTLVNHAQTNIEGALDFFTKRLISYPKSDYKQVEKKRLIKKKKDIKKLKSERALYASAHKKQLLVESLLKLTTKESVLQEFRRIQNPDKLIENSEMFQDKDKKESERKRTEKIRRGVLLSRTSPYKESIEVSLLECRLENLKLIKEFAKSTNKEEEKSSRSKTKEKESLDNLSDLFKHDQHPFSNYGY